MKAKSRFTRVAALAVAVGWVASSLSGPALGQVLPAPSTQPSLPATRPSASERAFEGLAGKNVEGVRVVGNQAVSASLILNAVRTREGEPFDPKTVEEDYQRVFALRRFANVEAKVEPTTSGGVLVIFLVQEQKAITAITYLGNVAVPTPTLVDAVDIRERESIDSFRISLARQNIERLYRDKNFPFASVEVDEEKLASTGEVQFMITEGPSVRIRKVTFPGNESFERDVLLDKIRSSSWIFVFRSGKLDFERLEDDVAALRRFYMSKGFFDVRVGRRLRFSPDLSQVQVDFVIDEGKRYSVSKITFKGATSVSDEELRKNLRLKEGDTWDTEIINRDVRQIVKAYSPFGFIYQPDSPLDRGRNPDYLHISPNQVYTREPGKVELVYDIEEGKPFRIGRILVKGNSQTMDKLVQREMRVQPGQMYNSSEIADAVDRIKSTPYFAEATVTPVGDDPNYRDVLVQVQEKQFRIFSIGAGVNSNGGVGGNITLEHRNFDIGQYPDRFGDLFTDRAFTGAGQRFRISIEPGTEISNASVLFSEPYLFDSPYSFTNEYYFRDRIRPDWQETRFGGRITIGRRLDYENSVNFTFRAEDVNVHDIEDEPIRAQDVRDLEGHSFISTYGLSFTRDTSNRGPVPYRGYTFRAGTEQAAPPGEFDFNRVSAAYDGYFQLSEDLVDRKTVLALHTDVGYIFGNAPFFERFYAGGLGSIRGFRFRGVSPRQGLDDDAIGGDFSLLNSAEVSYPIAGTFLRGVWFADSGTIEQDFEIKDYRISVGGGLRLYLPFFGSAPFALDFGVPVTKNGDDETQLISFFFGFNP